MTPARRAHLTYIRGLVQRMRAALAEADKQEREWKDLKAAYDVKFRTEQRIRAQRTKQKPISDLEKEYVMGEGRALKDAFGGQGWWREQAAVLATVVQAEIAWAQEMRQVENGDA